MFRIVIRFFKKKDVMFQKKNRKIFIQYIDIHKNFYKKKFLLVLNLVSEILIILRQSPLIFPAATLHFLLWLL